MSGPVDVFATGCVLITEPSGTFGCAEFSIPTLKPKFCRSFSASVWLLPVRSGISIIICVYPSTGSPSKILVKVHIVPMTIESDIASIVKRTPGVGIFFGRILLYYPPQSFSKFYFSLHLVVSYPLIFY